MTSKTRTALIASVIALSLLTCSLLFFVAERSFSTPKHEPIATLKLPPPAVESPEKEVKQFCGICHAYPAPDTFPRGHWRKEIARAYDFWRNSGLSFDYPSL